MSERAVKDAEVLKLAAAYIEAMNNLNRRLVELASADPTLSPNVRHAPSGAKNAAGAAAGASPSANHAFIKLAKEYHDFHGVQMTDEELLLDARKHGLASIEVLP
ncbi:hypothetical protein [Sorangium sp. So ce394]|uniref:hypothetical protein n=1 Tax=Sorangium sp. So ce394 TaxID=3133310 RepID=UPI003F5B29D0